MHVAYREDTALGPQFAKQFAAGRKAGPYAEVLVGDVELVFDRPTVRVARCDGRPIEDGEDHLEARLRKQTETQPDIPDLDLTKFS